MGERSEAEALYRKMGAPFRALAPWQIYVLTSSENFQRLYGARADKVKKLYNGMIPCFLYQYFKPKS
jgi:putative N6-adenine-specific DNA methylase